MMLNDRIPLQIGGFHDHWLRNGTDNATLLAAAAQYYHYDFICLMDGFRREVEQFRQTVESWLPGFRVFLGEERFYGWGHLVTVQNHFSGQDPKNPDIPGEIARNRAGGGFVALAHIEYPTTEEMVLSKGMLDHLIDENIVDAVQLGGTPAGWKWLEARAQAGKRLPLIGGWDSHLIQEKKGLTDVLYGAVSPAGHIDSAPAMRTIVFAEDASFETICQVVREGKSVLEEVETGQLFGSPKLVRILQENGYLETMQRLDEAYAALNLQCEALVAGGEASLRFPGTGTAWLPADRELTPRAVPAEDGTVRFSSIPMPVFQDESYLPIAWQGQGRKRMWAVRVYNDIQLVCQTERGVNGPELALYSKAPFYGTISVQEPVMLEKNVQCGGGEVLRIAVPEACGWRFSYRLTLRSDRGTVREYCGRGALIEAPEFHGDWGSCPEYAVDREEFCGGYGAGRRPYPGPNIFSARLRFAWDAEYFYLRTEYTDPIPIPPPAGRFMYEGDCAQLALDPLNRKGRTRKNDCEFNIGLPECGPQVWRVNMPLELAIARGLPEPQHQTEVKDAHVDVQWQPDGRIVTAAIPWGEICSVPVQAGLYMGIFLQLQNDNGQGLIDALEWPWTFPGMWMIPEEWGTLALCPAHRQEHDEI